MKKINVVSKLKEKVEKKNAEKKKRIEDKRLKNERLANTIRKDISEEKIYAEVYIEEIGEQPYDEDGKPTEDFMYWVNAKKELQNIDPDIVRSIVDAHITETFLKGENPDIRNMVLERKLTKAAKDIKSVFQYYKIFTPEVHGWLQINYPADYRLLLENFVLERAAYFAREEFESKPLWIIKGIDLSEYTKTGVKLMRPFTFDNFPEQTFDRAIFYTKKGFDASINWVEGVPYYIDEYPTKVTLGKANLALYDYATWNIPVFVVLHAPGMDYGLFDVTTDIEVAHKCIDNTRKQLIYDLRKILAPLYEKIDEKTRGEIQWRQAYAELINKVEVERGYNLEDEINEIEGTHFGNSKSRLISYVIAGIGVIFAVVAIIIFIVMVNI